MVERSDTTGCEIQEKAAGTPAGVQELQLLRPPVVSSHALLNHRLLAEMPPASSRSKSVIDGREDYKIKKGLFKNATKLSCNHLQLRGLCSNCQISAEVGHLFDATHIRAWGQRPQLFIAMQVKLKKRSPFQVWGQRPHLVQVAPPEPENTKLTPCLVVTGLAPGAINICPRWGHQTTTRELEKEPLRNVIKRTGSDHGTRWQVIYLLMVAFKLGGILE